MNRSRIRPIIPATLCLALAVALRAADPPSATDPAAGTPGEPSPAGATDPGAADAVPAMAEADPAPQPSFSLERDPFWPVGFNPDAQPEPEEPVVRAPTPDVEWPTLRLLGFFQSETERLAVIDGIGPVQKGDVVQRIAANRVFEWEILNVGDTTVEHRRRRHRPATPQDRTRLR